jgi:hypothetical protein
MGVTRFIDTLEVHFLSRLSDTDIPEGISPDDSRAVAEWFKDAFGVWFLQHRDDVLSKEWMKRGWAAEVLVPDSAGKLKMGYRVKPECVQQIDDWLQDRIE